MKILAAVVALLNAYSKPNRQTEGVYWVLHRNVSVPKGTLKKYSLRV
jgi:hypothetical protein